MAKGNPLSTTAQYKVHLKPTEIGLRVMERLERPHTDASPELRRLIELGYACEQAGFILDGTVLRHGGRSWDTQPDFSVEAETRAGSAGDPPTAGRKRAKAPSSAKFESGPSLPAAAQTDDVPAPRKVGDNPTTTSVLQRNLRGLSS